MKRRLTLLACFALVVAMVLSFCSCDLINKIIKPEEQQPEHTHNFVEGKCECGEEDPNYVPPHTHNFVDGKCECGEEDPNYNPTCEHQYGYEVTTEPTCTEDGVKTFTCALCGDSYTQPVAQLGHTEERIPGTAPTCNDKGLSDGKKCSVCGEILQAQNEINATGHTFVEGKCECGEIDPNYNGPKTYVFHYSDVVAGADKDAIAEGTTFANGYFTIVGGVTQRVKDGAVYCVEVAKNGGGAIQFTVTGTATVEVQFSSTGKENTSKIGIFDAEGNLVANNEGIITVTGASAGMTVVTYNLPAGTYSVVSPASDVDAGETDYNRGARVFYVNVTETPAEEVPAQEIKVETTDTYTMYNLDFFTFTATAEGYYTFKIPAGLGAMVDGSNAPEVDYYMDENGGEFTVGLEEGQEIVVWVSAVTKDMWTIEWSFEAGEVEDQPDDPIEGDATELVVGSNNLVFADGELSQGKTYPFTVTEEGTYTFRSDLMAVVMDADGNTLGRGQASLTPGTYSVTFFSMMPMPSNSFTVNITFEAPATGEPDGSEEYPFVWETLPESVTFESDNMNMVYYVFTATADGSVTFTWAVEGNDWFNYFELVDGMTTANNASGYAKTSHTFVVEAGKTYRVGLGTWNEGGETVVTIAFVACAHEWSEATCQTLSTCAKCGATTGDYADHIPNSENPTCADPAECTVCGTEVGYVPHEWNEGVVTQNPDCSTETNGIKLLTCTVCGATEEETIWVFHDWVVDENVEATCTTDGYYKAHCSVCNKIDEETSEAQGHYNWYEGTCGDTVTCLECGESFVKEHFFWFEATCTQAAYCGNCEQYVGEPAGHQYAYPCDKFCSVCYEETNPNATHTIVHVDAVAATCYENGNVEYWYCSDCGATWTDEALTQVTNQMSIVTPMAHAEATHVEAVAPTCYENGNIEYWLCEACGQAWLDAECTKNTNVMAVVLPMAHDPATHVEAKDATCTVDGNIEYWICEPCGQVWLDEACTLNSNVKSVVLPALGHVDEGGDFKCDVCSAKVLPEDGATLTVAQALVIAKMQSHNTYTTQKYYITGIVTNLYNTQYGNFYIKDADGNELCIYGLYMDGTRYDAMNYKPVEGDEVTVYGPLGAYNTTYQMKNAELDDVVAHEHDYTSVVTDPTCVAAGFTTHTCSICKDSYTDSEVAALGHTTESGECERCGLTIGGDAPVIGELARFDFGANGSAAHVDGNDLGTSKSYTAGSQTLSLTGMSKVYGPAYDAKGNSCIKLGTSSKTGSFSFTVGENVTEVVIYVAQYKANTTKVNVNGVDYTITTASNNGEYTAITIDTSVTKTVTFNTVSGGVRCMIDSIVFNGIAA